MQLLASSCSCRTAVFCLQAPSPPYKMSECHLHGWCRTHCGHVKLCKLWSWRTTLPQDKCSQLDLMHVAHAIFFSPCCLPPSEFARVAEWVSTPSIGSVHLALFSHTREGRSDGVSAARPCLLSCLTCCLPPPWFAWQSGSPLPVSVVCTWLVQSHPRRAK